MTKTTYKVSDGYASRKFDEHTEAMKFAVECYNDHVSDGKSKSEAAKLVTITTYTTSDETLFDAIGAWAFED